MSPELLHVYVIEDENHIIKIGIAGNVTKRLNSIDTSSGYEIINLYESPSCANARKIEKVAHKHFVNRRKKGEWFNVPFDEAVNFIKGHFVNTAQQLSLPVGPVELDREFNGHAIRQRTIDGYFDATAMCQATGKRWVDYFENKTTQLFLGTLSKSENLALLELVQSERGRYGGTWIHPYVSVNLAQWCSPEFAVQVSKWVFELMTKGHVSLNGQTLTPEVETYITARVRDEVANALAKPKTVTNSSDDDEWLILIENYLENKDKCTITLVLKNALKLDLNRCNKNTRNRVADVLRSLGWKQSGRILINGKHKRGWKRSN